MRQQDGIPFPCITMLVPPISNSFKIIYSYGKARLLASLPLLVSKDAFSQLLLQHEY